MRGISIFLYAVLLLQFPLLNPETFLCNTVSKVFSTNSLGIAHDTLYTNLPVYSRLVHNNARTRYRTIRSPVITRVRSASSCAFPKRGCTTLKKVPSSVNSVAIIPSRRAAAHGLCTQSSSGTSP